MSVTIVEAWEKGAALQLNNLCPWAGSKIDVRVSANRQDPVAADGDRLVAFTRAVQRQDGAAPEHHLRHRRCLGHQSLPRHFNVRYQGKRRAVSQTKVLSARKPSVPSTKSPMNMTSTLKSWYPSDIM